SESWLCLNFSSMSTNYFTRPSLISWARSEWRISLPLASIAVLCAGILVFERRSFLVQNPTLTQLATAALNLLLTSILLIAALIYSRRLPQSKQDDAEKRQTYFWRNWTFFWLAMLSTYIVRTVFLLPITGAGLNE